MSSLLGRACYLRESDVLHLALQAYLKKIEEVVTFLKKAGMGGTAKYAVDALSVRLEDAKKFTSTVLPYLENGAEVVLAQVNQAWATLATHPQGEFYSCSYGIGIVYLFMLKSCQVSEGSGWFLNDGCSGESAGEFQASSGACSTQISGST